MKRTEDTCLCDQCLYYYPYYIKSDYGFLQKTELGVCSQRNVFLTEAARKGITKVTCEEWKSIQPKLQRRKNCIEKVLRNMADRIYDISIMLEDDRQ